MPLAKTHIDYSTLEGGIVRMIDRYKESGTLTGEPEVDEYLAQDPNAALLGLLYDQRVRAESAFKGPFRLRERLGHLDMAKIAAMDHQELVDMMRISPAVHRFAGTMADYTKRVAEILTNEYGGDASNLWNHGVDFPTVQKRIRKLPGFGAEKAEKLRYVLHYFGHRDFSTEEP